MGAMIEKDRYCLDTRHDEPYRRLAAIIGDVTFASPIYGLIRSLALKKTRLIGNFASSDRVLVTELAMLGKIHEIPEYLFLRRKHCGSSRGNNKSHEEMVQWFDPSKKGGLLSERQRLNMEYIKSVWFSQQSVKEKVSCTFAVERILGTRRLRAQCGRWKRRVLGPAS